MDTKKKKTVLKKIKKTPEKNIPTKKKSIPEKSIPEKSIPEKSIPAKKVFQKKNPEKKTSKKKSIIIIEKETRDELVIDEKYSEKVKILINKIKNQTLGESENKIRFGWKY